MPCAPSLHMTCPQGTAVCLERPTNDRPWICFVVCNEKCAEPIRKLLTIEAQSHINYVVLCLRVHIDVMLLQGCSHLIILLHAQREDDHWLRLYHCRESKYTTKQLLANTDQLVINFEPRKLQASM